MQLSLHEDGAWTFTLGLREKRLFWEVLQAYPVLDPAYQPPSRSASPAQLQSSRELLKEALAAQQEENRRMLRGLLGKAQGPDKPGLWIFTLDAHQVENLLQVLNDVRVGHWRALGCPDNEKQTLLEMAKSQARSVLLMKLCGHFQMQLLQAMDM